MKKIGLLLLVALQTAGFAAGEAGMAALKIGAGARAAAMGEAFMAVSDDVTAVFWNPAGLAGLESRQAHFTHNEWIQDVRHEVAGLAVPTGVGTFGLGLMLNNVDGFERRTIASEEPLDTFSAQSFAITLSYARPVGEALAIGLNLKYLNEKIYIDDANAFMADLGVQYRGLADGLVLAAAVQNIGASTAMDEEKIDLPMASRIGAAWRLPVAIFDQRLNMAADYVSIFSEKSYLNFGAEAEPVDNVFLRLGYQTGFKEKSISAGFGLHFDHLKIDYGYVPFTADLGNTHRFSITTLF